MALLAIGIVALVLWLIGRGGSGSAGISSPPGFIGSFGGAGSSTSVNSYGLGAIAQAVAMVESGGQQYDAQGNVITSPAGALGIMQLMPGTAAQYGVDPNNQQQNMAGGTQYLQDLYSKYGNWNDALAAYNWGPGNVDRALASGSPFPSSVQSYVNSVESELG